jgi:hypothetical protein
MNLFNCFQAVGFYTLLPFLMMWLHNNGYNTWVWIAGIVQFIGYCMISAAVHESKFLKDR